MYRLAFLRQESIWAPCHRGITWSKGHQGTCGDGVYSSLILKGRENMAGHVAKDKDANIPQFRHNPYFLYTPMIFPLLKSNYCTG